jgi:hypothetical protein
MESPMDPNSIFLFLKGIQELDHLRCLLFQSIFPNENWEDKFIFFLLLQDFNIISLNLEPLDFYKLFLTQDGRGINHHFVNTHLLPNFLPIPPEGFILTNNLKECLYNFSLIMKPLHPSPYLIDFYKSIF